MIDAALQEKISAFFEENRQSLIEDIRTVVAVPSLQGEAAPGAPFGPGPKEALEKALAIAQRMGLATENCEGYVGYADLPGTDSRYVATISHLDVVPAGNGWKAEPFIMREREGWLIGRGTGDNKGPSITALYLLKYFKENGGLRYGLRAILGTNEETGMKDMEYYLEHLPAPAFAFTPDGAFPAGIGEKGVYHAKLFSAPIEGAKVTQLEAGQAFNVVPDRAHVLIQAEAGTLPEAENIEVTETQKGLYRVEAFGKGAHAAFPQGGINALKILTGYLLGTKALSAAERPFFEMCREILSTTDASAIGLASDDGVFDPLTCSCGMAGIENGSFMLSIDIRYPTSTTKEVLDAGFEALLAKTGGGRIEYGMCSGPFYIQPEDPAIQCLVDTYNEITERNEKPFVSGGGTYARKFPKAVSYGLGRHGEEQKPDFIGGAHGAEEGISLAAIYEALTIFIVAVQRLNELEL